MSWPFSHQAQNHVDMIKVLESNQFLGVLGKISQESIQVKLRKHLCSPRVQRVEVHTYITLHYITLQYITFHHIPLHSITLHSITSHSITLHTCIQLTFFKVNKYQMWKNPGFSELSHWVFGQDIRPTRPTRPTRRVTVRTVWANLREAPAKKVTQKLTIGISNSPLILSNNQYVLVCHNL